MKWECEWLSATCLPYNRQVTYLWCVLLFLPSERLDKLYLTVALDRIRKNRLSQTDLPWEICTSATKRSLRGSLCGMTARSAIPLMMLSQCAANSSGRSRFRTASDGTVRMMFSNSNSAQGEGAVRSKDQSAGVVTPEKN